MDWRVDVSLPYIVPETAHAYYLPDCSMPYGDHALKVLADAHDDSFWHEYVKARQW